MCVCEELVVNAVQTCVSLRDVQSSIRSRYCKRMSRLSYTVLTADVLCHENGLHSNSPEDTIM